jgi:hypothetical protein
MRVLGLSVVSLAALAGALPNRNVIVKRQITQLRPSYDFVIVGGGTSGLTVADRLTEAFPESRPYPINLLTTHCSPQQTDRHRNRVGRRVR